MTANDFNQETISFSGESYKSVKYTSFDRIDAYFHESNDAVACNSDQCLGPAYSSNGSTAVSFSFADSSNTLSNSEFFALPDHSISYKPISNTDSQKNRNT